MVSYGLQTLFSLVEDLDTNHHATLMQTDFSAVLLVRYHTNSSWGQPGCRVSFSLLPLSPTGKHSYPLPLQFDKVSVNRYVRWETGFHLQPGFSTQCPAHRPFCSSCAAVNANSLFSHSASLCQRAITYETITPSDHARACSGNYWNQSMQSSGDDLRDKFTHNTDSIDQRVKHECKFY